MEQLVARRAHNPEVTGSSPVPATIIFIVMKSGDDSKEDTPVPISNTEVKLFSAEDTWWETAWENRTLPVFFNLYL